MIKEIAITLGIAYVIIAFYFGFLKKNRLFIFIRKFIKFIVVIVIVAVIIFIFTK